MAAKPAAGGELLSTFIGSKDWNYSTLLLYCTSSLVLLEAEYTVTQVLPSAL